MEALARLKEVDAKLTLYFDQLTWTDYIEQFFTHLPWPAWIKAEDGTMVAINPAYAARYGINESTYQGTKDEPWPPEVRRVFSDNDLEVAKSGVPCTYVERVENPKTGQRENITVVKFPVYAGPDLVGVGGFAVYLPT